MLPSGGPGELQLPPAEPPEDTPEPDSLPEVVEALTGTDEAAAIDDAIASVPQHLWANPDDFPDLK